MKPFIAACISSYVPSTLHINATSAFTKINECLSEKERLVLEARLSKSPELTKQLLRALIGSEYIVESCCRQPDLLFTCLLSEAPYSPLSPIKIIDAVETACSDTLTQGQFDSLLRKLRRRFMLVLYWRDTNNLASFEEVSQAMTAMAEVFIQQAMSFHYEELVKKYGVPVGESSQKPQPMLVVGMGKLGACELNVSSDIDLIFTFPESGKTQLKESKSKIKSIDNQQFFNYLGKCLIKSLSDVTVDGFVFRVDMRLRPYGQSGSLTSNFASLENYYQTQGREWERFAGIKARVVAINGIDSSVEHFSYAQQAQEDLVSIIRSFVYRKYVDYTMINALRKLKLMIEQEVRRKGIESDIKLGMGGIREIEFIVQSLQLIRGGLDRELQERNLLRLLGLAADKKIINNNIKSDLREAYLFLRKLEHTIQAYKDEQTQRLPSDLLELERIAWIVNDSDANTFLGKLEDYKLIVNKEFKIVFADAEKKNELPQDNLPEFDLLWSDLSVSQNMMSDLNENDVIKIIKDFKESRNVNSLSSGAREKLDDFIPLLLRHVEERSYNNQDEKLQSFNRIFSWLEAIVTRTAYLSLMLENTQILKHLVDLFSASSWVSQTLTQVPSLLDELLSASKLYTLPNKSSLKDELRQRLLRLEPDDVEAHMEALRYFRLAHYLHVAACEISGVLPLMKVSDYLTLIAEVVLAETLQLAWNQMVDRYGVPPNTSSDAMRFVVIGYGKLGGMEMSYSSDLDLVFIYDIENNAMTSGTKSIESQVFYTRLGQKIIHLLNTRTSSGPLYEVDMRLRPSGNSGLLVSSFAAYSRYQRESAWVWEHQALVRARSVCGDTELAESFSAMRRELLGGKRNSEHLKSEVIKMRHKMREHLGSSSKNSKNNGQSAEFNLKQDSGGIVDIEFMVQYAVLAWSHEYPSLSEWTDNIRILESLQKLGFIEAAQAHYLIEIYQSYRAETHRFALQQQSSVSVRGDCYLKERRQVEALWKSWFD